VWGGQTDDTSADRPTTLSVKELTTQVWRIASSHSAWPVNMLWMKFFVEVYRLRLSVFTHSDTDALWWCAYTETEKKRNRVLAIENWTESNRIWKIQTHPALILTLTLIPFPALTLLTLLCPIAPQCTSKTTKLTSFRGTSPQKRSWRCHTCECIASWTVTSYQSALGLTSQRLVFSA